MQELNAAPQRFTQMDVARRAFEIFLAEGRPPGRDAEHWFQAERELTAEAEARDAADDLPAPDTEANSTRRPKARQKTSR